MKKLICFSTVATIVLLVGLNLPLVSAAGLPEIPKPSLPSLPPVPTVPSVPSPPAAVTTAAPATVDQKIEIQQKKIELGLKSKLLTQAEATTLQDNLKYVKERETRFKADGKLSIDDSEWLAKALDYNNRMIENKKTTPVKDLKDLQYPIRFELQQDKINRAIASGALNKNEAKEVQDDLDKIKAQYARLEKDGKLSGEERERLNNMLAHNNRLIITRSRPAKK